MYVNHIFIIVVNSIKPTNVMMCRTKVIAINNQIDQTNHRQ